MILGVVGSEAAKFTPDTEARARSVIRTLLQRLRPTLVVSGRCHLGGVDIFAVEEAAKAGIPFREHPPQTYSWAAGYKPRNVKIAVDSDAVACLTLRELPPGYTGMRFALCYHCGTSDHVKSGGCWTVKYAKSIGKRGQVIVL